MYQILHVDDEPDLAEVTATFLEREADEFSVAIETDAPSALDRLDGEDFDCIVSDYQMPGMDGLTFFDRVREKYSDLPFILYTGQGSEAVASDAIAHGVTDYLQKQPGTEQYELLANRCLNAIEQRRAEQRATDLARIRDVIRDVNQALVRADTHDELKQRVCEIIADAEPYLFAWFGMPDPETGRVVPQTSAGLEADYLDEIEITVGADDTGQGPTGRAVTTKEMQVMQDVHEDPAYEPWREAALERGYQSSAAVPLVCGDDVIGVLNVYASRPHAFDESERDLFVELADDIAHALHALDLKRDLQQTTARLTALFDNSPDMINVHDASGEIVDVNPRFCNVLGYSRDAIIGKHVWDVDQDADPEEIRDFVREISPGDRREVRGRYRRRDGSTFPAEVHIRCLDVDGDARYMVISRDISERIEQDA